MAHTYSNNYIHCIFSTKDRRPLIQPARMQQLYNYMGAIAREENFSLIAAGGTDNHVHLLFPLPPTCSLAHSIQKLKGGSSRWMGQGFSGQEFYGAFSVSPSQLTTVKTCIQGQEAHHRKQDFEEEFIALLRHCRIPYDKRYVFG